MRNLFILIILIAGGVIAFRYLAPEQWNQTLGKLKAEPAPEAAADTPEAAPPPLVLKAPAKPKAEPRAKPQAAPKAATKAEPAPVEEPTDEVAVEPAPDAKAPAAPTINAAGEIGWGVVSATLAPAYNRQGKKVAEIGGGEPFVIRKAATAGGKPAYLVVLDTRRQKPECLLFAEDTSATLTPPPELKTDREGFITYFTDRKALTTYYSALASRTQLEERLRDQHLAKSPAKDLPKLKKELASIPAKDREYETRQKNARSNAERLKYQDLRKELRYTAEGLQADIKRLTAEKAKWEAAHPFNEAVFTRNAVWRALTKNIEKARPAAEAVEAKR